MPNNQIINSLSQLNYKRFQRFAELLFTYALPANSERFSKLLIITNSSVCDKAQFIESCAYDFGYGYVHIEVIDEFNIFKRMEASLNPQNAKTLKFFPDFEQNIYAQAAEEGWNVLNITTNEEFKITDYLLSLPQENRTKAEENYKEFTKRLNRIKTPLTQACSDNICPHCLVALPSTYWEKQVVNTWDKFAESFYLDFDDYNQKFKNTLEHIEQKAKKLNDFQASSVLIKNSNTELKVVLSPLAKWQGGRVQAKDGTLFMPNFPSYEVYISPIAGSEVGYFTSTSPITLSATNKTITSPTRFGFSADKTKNMSKLKSTCSNILDQEAINEFLAKDKALNNLGEIGVVDSTSPIYLKSGFNNTLFDENTGTHIALGSSIMGCFPSFSSVTSDSAKKSAGFNICSAHQDIVIADDKTQVFLYNLKGECINILQLN